LLTPNKTGFPKHRNTKAGRGTYSCDYQFEGEGTRPALDAAARNYREAVPRGIPQHELRRLAEGVVTYALAGPLQVKLGDLTAAHFLEVANRTPDF